jgi:hypothetical protein
VPPEHERRCDKSDDADDERCFVEPFGVNHGMSPSRGSRRREHPR